GTWDGTVTNWNTDPTGGSAGGALRGDINAGNDGVFSAGDPNTSYFAEIPDGGSVSAGSLSVNQGAAYVAGDGNAGQGGPFGGNSPSLINIGSTNFNINVATGASLTVGFRLRLATFAGSAVINKTGGGFFNNVTDNLVTHVGPS